MKYYIIAGEASGDLHASNLIKELKMLDATFECRAWDGDLMAQQGVYLVKHYRDLAFMGFVEVIANLRTILRNIDFCKRDILEYQPDAVILIDYPGFNLRIAEFSHHAGLKVHYYISPQIWAWKQSRVHQIKKNVDQMLVILPFEKDFYSKFDYKVDFVGHPLLDAINNRNSSNKQSWQISNNPYGKDIVAVLPGSRKQEISTMLPLMLSVKKDFPNHLFVVGAAPAVDPAFYDSVINDKDVKVVYGQTYDLLENAVAALVTSGTATLETALFNIPEIVCYKGNVVSYYIARRLVKVKYISLVNLIMDREVVKELIQDDLNAKSITNELNKLLNNTAFRNKMLEDFSELKMLLGGPGASKRAAQIIVNRQNKFLNN
ncbi:MAG: lipid-A-disaccharide synthase [Bacteroidetes bacterium]|nr:lipid-A-disaccharide synthase [Bacteroidota bacterium]